MINKINFFLFCLFTVKCYAQNPITPPGSYLSDPTVHVWNDGKLPSQLLMRLQNDSKEWETISAKVNNTKGIRAIWRRFSGKGEDICSVDWFQFFFK